MQGDWAAAGTRVKQSSKRRVRKRTVRKEEIPQGSSHTGPVYTGLSVSLPVKMSAQTDGLADLAREVLSQLAATREADDTRRPWIRASLGQGVQPMFLGIQHHDGRATWVVKHNGDKEVRFPISKEEPAVWLFKAGVLKNNREWTFNGVCVELVHMDHVLRTTYIKDGATGEFYSMIKVLKSAI